MTSPHLSTSGRRPAPARGARSALVAVLCGLVAVVGAPGGALAQEAESTDEAGAARVALTNERDTAVGELTSVESELAAAAQRLVATEAELATRREERTTATTDLEVARAEREEPLAIRRAVAIEVYMAGDPNAASLIREILEANSSMDGARDRAVFSAVVEWAEEAIDRFDAEIATATEQLADLDERIPALESDMEELAEGRAAQMVRRDELTTQIDDLNRRLRWLNRSPLTGLPSDEIHTRPILIVKIDNVRPARPQAGLNQADIVIEERVEAGLSRFAALFQSTAADPVGPVRSARTSDVLLFANLGSPLFAFSGANAGVGGAVASSTLVDVGAGAQRAHYDRVSGRRAPHNLFTNTSSLWASTPGSPPLPIFEFRDDGAGLPAGARPAIGVDLTYGSADALFAWDGSGWVRSSDGRAHPDAAGVSIAPANVVVRFTDYVPSPADSRSPEAVVTGSGELWVLTAGHVVVGRWEQESLTSPTRWLDADGAPIPLTPGRTWIVMPSPGDASLR
ncbi:MAG: DUF3048 domain-containing protein [Acidimicrobiia bacterium]|nr:DUF3048 domain-containing protein [Acidimicrobiia bacterium]